MTLIDKNDLPSDDIGSEFEGYAHGNTPVSFILIDTAPGNGPKLHSHPYDEVIIVPEGHVTAVIGERTVQASGGGIIVIPAHTPHSFVNSGTEKLRQVGYSCQLELYHHVALEVNLLSSRVTLKSIKKLE